MKESLKGSSKTLYGVCACIIILMLACYFGNNSIKGTYSSSDVTSVTCEGTIYSSSKLWLSAGNYYCCPSGTSEMTTGSCWYYQKCAKDECDNINPTGATWSCKNVFVSLIDGYRRECSTRAVAALTKTVTACSEVVSSSPCGKSQVITTNSSFSCVGYVYKKVDYDKNASCSEDGGSYTLYKFEKTGCASGYTENAAGVCVKNSSESEEGCYTANNAYQWFQFNPGSKWTKVDITQADCIGCKTGYSKNDDGDCVPKSSIGKCYICLGTSGSVSSGGYYQWSSSGSNCHVAESTTCTGTPSPKKYECTLTDNSKVCVTAYDSAWAGASVSETGTSCKEVTSCSSSGGGNTPSNPSTPSSSTPSSSTPSSTPSSSSNVDENPKTGSVAIFLVWIIALGTLVYAGVYFKQVRENN